MNAQLNPALSNGISTLLDAVHREPPFQSQAATALAGAGMHYWTADDAKSSTESPGLWCVNAGTGGANHEAVTKQLAPWNSPRHFRWDIPSPSNSPIGCQNSASRPRSNFSSPTPDPNRRYRLEDCDRLSRARGAGQRVRLIGREKGYHGWDSAACRSAAWSTTAVFRLLHAPGSITCLIPWTSSTTRFRAACRSGERILPTSSSASSPCTTRRRSQPSSSTHIRIRRRRPASDRLS